MEQHKLEITLEQRDWERLQKLSERNGESMESLTVKMIARELARTFNKPPDVVISVEARRIYDSFIEGKNVTRRMEELYYCERKYFKNSSKLNE